MIQKIVKVDGAPFKGYRWTALRKFDAFPGMPPREVAFGRSAGSGYMTRKGAQRAGEKWLDSRS